MMRDLIKGEDISFVYEDEKEPAIEGADFTAEEGKLIFITGKSGSGKSTLLNIINGIIPEVTEGELSGKLEVGGKKDLPIYEKSRILGNVFQNPRSQFFTTDTTAEMVFAMENYGVGREEISRRLDETVEEFNVGYLMDRDIFGMSSGERQLLALLSVLITKPDAVIFDEPSANLDYGNAMRLSKEIAELKKKGKTVVVADHRCFYLRGIIDEVWLVDGRSVRKFSSESEFLGSGYASRITDIFDGDYGEREIQRGGERSVSVEDVSYKGILEHLSVGFNKGEVTAVVGVNGAGKTTLAKLISKAVKPDSGKIKTDDRVLYILQEADFQLFGYSCMSELAINCKDEDRNLKALERLGLLPYKDKHPQMLSGGQKQRLQLALALVSDMGTVILDEPTSGLDKESMEMVADVIETLKKECTVVVSTHDYEFIRKVADRVVFIRDKKIGENFCLTKENIGKLNGIYREMEEFYEQQTQG